jgi:hypothetical protein
MILILSGFCAGVCVAGVMVLVILERGEADGSSRRSYISGG